MSAARNSLLAAAQGDYLWFIDSDDKLNTDAIPALHALIRQHHPDLVLCDYRVLRSKRTLRHYSRDESHLLRFLKPTRL